MKKEIRKALSKWIKYIYINSSYIDGGWGSDLNLIEKKEMTKEQFRELEKDIHSITNGAGNIYIWGTRDSRQEIVQW